MSKTPVVKGLLGLCVLFGSLSASAMDDNGKFAIKGVGNASCATYVSVLENDDPQKFLFAGWLNGYVTAQNQHIDETFDVTTWESIETLGTYLFRYCQANREHSFFHASTQLVNELYAARIVNFVGAVELKQGDTQQKMYAQVIERLQQALKEKGLYDGEVNGKADAALSDSVKAFADSKGMTGDMIFSQRVIGAILRDTRP